MAQKRKISDDYVRVRVAFPIAAAKQLEDLAGAMGIDVPTLVRVMSLLQLQQWRMIANPGLLMAGNAQLQERYVAGLLEALPELRELGLSSDELIRKEP